MSSEVAVPEQHAQRAVRGVARGRAGRRARAVRHDHEDGPDLAPDHDRDLPPDDAASRSATRPSGTCGWASGVGLGVIGAILLGSLAGVTISAAPPRRGRPRHLRLSLRLILRRASVSRPIRSVGRYAARGARPRLTRLGVVDRRQLHALRYRRVGHARLARGEHAAHRVVGEARRSPRCRAPPPRPAPCPSPGRRRRPCSGR